MDEVDDIIIGMLRTVGCDIPDDVKHVGVLDASTVVEGVVRCIWLIQPSANIQSYSLSPSMATRFRQANHICQLVKDLGYKNEIGYETLLYGNEYDTRKLLLFLSDKLPSESAAATSKELDPLEIWRYKAAESFSRNAEAPWIPHFCRRLNLNWNGKYWCPPDLIENISFTSHALSSPLTFADLPLRDIPASLIEKCTSSAQKDHISEFEVLKFVIEGSSAARRARLKPKLSPKPKLPPKPAKISISSNELQSVQEEKDVVPSKADELQSQLSNLLELVEQAERIRLEQQQNISQISRELDGLNLSGAKSEGLVSEKRQMAMMLTDPEAFCGKIENFIAASSSKMEKIGQKCASVKQERVDMIENLKQSAGFDNEAERLSIEVRDMENKIDELDQEISVMQNVATQLQAEHNKLTKGISRSAYTKRILEIVHSVRKQREAIDKVLNDTRGIQKEINGLHGRLDRSFIAADQVLLKSAQTDGYSKRAYKLVTTFRDECAALGKVMEDTGHTQREMQELQDQIEVESQKKISEQLNRLVSDYCVIRQENETLQAKIDMVTVENC